WQLIQVQHISERPIILLGGMWEGLIEWMKSEPLKKNLISKNDFKNIIIVKDVDEAIEILKPSITNFYEKAQTNKEQTLV
ncbi:MAG: LOG family protein, partial [Candidatus Marinimicrobia bacterium]|nr:LOG family protein [Candidatus Neomarinimicrobiota bacterium]